MVIVVLDGDISIVEFGADPIVLSRHQLIVFDSEHRGLTLGANHSFAHWVVFSFLRKSVDPADATKQRF